MTSWNNAAVEQGEVQHAMMVSMQGSHPEMQSAMDLYHILSESDTHLRQPVALETQLLADEDMDDEVGKSMLALLQVGSAFAH